MLTDPIIEEIHKIRDEHAKKFNYNLSEIFNDLKEQEKRSGKKFVSLPVKRAVRKEEKKVKSVV
jgi:hypothetical protein